MTRSPQPLRRRPAFPSRTPAVVAALGGALLWGGCVESNRGVLEVNPAADSVQVVTGITDTGFVRTPMPNRPVVVVKDAQGFRMPGVPVVFTPDSGSGFVSEPRVRTDSAGRASTTWTAGPDTGQQTLRASVVGAPNARASRAEIRARVIDPCQRPAAYVLGTTVSGTLTGRGCITAGPSLVQPYAVSVETPSVWRFTVRSQAFPAYVEVTTPSGVPVGFYDLGADSVASVQVAFPTGAFHVRAGALNERAATGGFQLSSAGAALPPTCPSNGVQAWITPGTSLPATLAAGDCAPTLTLSNLGTFQTFADFYGVIVPPNRVVTVRMSSAAVNALLLLVGANSQQILTFNDDGGGGTNALLQFTAQQLGAAPGQVAVIWVVAASRGAAPGSYTISVDP